MTSSPPARRGPRAEPVLRERWVDVVRGFADHNYRQTWDFGLHAAARVGAASEHVVFADGGRVVGAADVRVRRLPLVGGIAYVTGGPLTRTDGSFDAARFAAVVRALRDEYAERRGLVVRVAAPVGPPSWNRDAAAALAGEGFRPAEGGGAYRTFLVDLTRPLPGIRASLRQKWRNCLHKAERAGLAVREAQDVESLDRFRALFDAFVARKGFPVRLGADFYARVQRDLPGEERFVVLLAEKDGELVAGHLSSVLGDTSVYLLGATAEAGLTCCAAYLLQWRAIEVAKARGCARYDLGGADPDANPGVWHFKEGLGGEDVVAAGPAEWHAGPRAKLVLALEQRWRAVREARPAPAARRTTA